MWSLIVESRCEPHPTQDYSHHSQTQQGGLELKRTHTTLRPHTWRCWCLSKSSNERPDTTRWIPPTHKIVFFCFCEPFVLREQILSGSSRPVFCVRVPPSHRYKHAAPRPVRGDGERDGRWAPLRGGSLQSYKASSRRPPETLVCVQSQRSPHPHINTRRATRLSRGNVQTFSGLVWDVRRDTANTATIHSDSKHAVLCSASRVCSPLDHSHRRASTPCEPQSYTRP